MDLQYSSQLQSPARRPKVSNEKRELQGDWYLFINSFLPPAPNSKSYGRARVLEGAIGRCLRNNNSRIGMTMIAEQMK